MQRPCRQVTTIQDTLEHTPLSDSVTTMQDTLGHTPSSDLDNRTGMKRLKAPGGVSIRLQVNQLSGHLKTEEPGGSN